MEQNYSSPKKFSIKSRGEPAIKQICEKILYSCGSRIWKFCSEGVSSVVTALVVLCVIIALFIWPGFSRPQTLNSVRTENQIKDLVERNFGWSDITDIQCNTGDVSIKKGNLFVCVVSSEDIHAKIVARFTDDSGDYSISKPVFNS